MTPTPTQAPANDPLPRIEDGHKPVPQPANVADQIDATSVDNGPVRAADAKKTPERKCIATGEHGFRDKMLRFVLGPDGIVTPDISARLPGRGAWTLAHRDAINTAVAKKSFNRAFKTQVEAPENLAETVETLLGKKCLDVLGFAKRGGDLILGFEKVRETIRAARPACLVEASDSAEDGRRKLLSLTRGLYANADLPGGTSVIGCFSAEELGMALGRDRVIHAVVKQGQFSKIWHVETSRLSGFRPLVPDDWFTGAA